MNSKNHLVKLSILFTLFNIRHLLDPMKWVKLTIFSGFALIILGIVFHLQGQAMIGPESSFMYSNQNWINYGFQIAITGAIVTVIGMFFRFRKTFP